MARSTIGTMLEYQQEGGKYVEIKDVQSIPALGGAPQEIDVTNLTDTESSSVPGVKQQSSLEIVLYMNNTKEDDNYRVCRKLELEGEVVPFRITFPDGTRVAFKAIPITSINEAAVNSAQLFTLSLFKRGDFNIANPDDKFVLIDGVEDMELYEGDFDNVTVRVIPSEAKITAQSESSDTAVTAVYGKQITVQALKAGSAKITVTASNGDAQATKSFTVTVKAVSDAVPVAAKGSESKPVAQAADTQTMDTRAAVKL